MRITAKCGHTWEGSIDYYGHTCPTCGYYTKSHHKPYKDHPVPDGYEAADLEEARGVSGVLTQNFQGSGWRAFKWSTALKQSIGTQCLRHDSRIIQILLD